MRLFFSINSSLLLYKNEGAGMKGVFYLLFRNSLSARNERLVDAVIAVLHGISTDFQLGLPLLMATGFDGEKQHRSVPKVQFH